MLAVIIKTWWHILGKETRDWFLFYFRSYALGWIHPTRDALFREKWEFQIDYWSMNRIDRFNAINSWIVLPVSGTDFQGSSSSGYSIKYYVVNWSMVAEALNLVPICLQLGPAPSSPSLNELWVKMTNMLAFQKPGLNWVQQKKTGKPLWYAFQPFLQYTGLLQISIESGNCRFVSTPDHNWTWIMFNRLWRRLSSLFDGQINDRDW